MKVGTTNTTNMSRDVPISYISACRETNNNSKKAVIVKKLTKVVNIISNFLRINDVDFFSPNHLAISFVG